MLDRPVASRDTRTLFRTITTMRYYVRLYAFLAQVLTFTDASLEKLYEFARNLRKLPPESAAEYIRTRFVGVVAVSRAPQSVSA